MQLPRFRSVARSSASAAAWRVSPTRVRRISVLAVLVVIASISLAGIIVVTRGAHAATTSTGDPYTWGSNGSGSLGNGNAFGGSSATPFHITSIGTPITSLVSGSDASHVLAVGADGSLWGWGDNTSNELTPDGATSNYWTPFQVPNVSGVTAAATGNGFTLALKTDGTVWAWGANGFGQLGIGTTANTATPTPVSFSLPTGVTIKAISAGGYHSLALDSTGNVWAWGYNNSGQLGNGGTTNSSAPVQVTTGTTFTAVAAGQYFSLALDSTGNIWAWGSNSSGQLGNGSSGGTVSTPTAISGLSGVSSISAGQSFGVAATSSAVYAWGNNADGEAGTGSLGGTVLTPSQVTGLSGVAVAAVAAGDRHALALSANGSVYAWGFDNNFQVGANAGTLTCDIFSDVCTPSAVVVPGVTGAGAVSAGIQFSLALVPSAPAATLSATSLSFGNQAQGTQSGAQSVTVTNTGAGTLSFNASAVSMGGANAADYTLTDGCSGQTVGPGSSCTLSVTFKPAALGASSATMTINDNAPTTPQTVALSGNGTYAWSGVQSSTGTTTFKVGSKVGLQFSLTGASAGIKTATAQAFDAVVTNGTPGSYAATTGSPPNTGNNFSYNSHSANYTYTWSTKGLSAGTYSVQVVLNDGTTGYITITLQ